jgi:hypothetical protein
MRRVESLTGKELTEQGALRELDASTLAKLRSGL